MPTHISINCIYTYIWIAQPSIFLYQQMHCIVSSHYHPLLIIFKHCDFSINLNPLSLCILHQCESTSVNPPLVRICPSMRICPSWESPINLNSLSLCILHKCKSSIGENHTSTWIHYHYIFSTSVNPPSVRICPPWESPINLNSLLLYILHQCESSIGENLFIVRITHQPKFTITMYSPPVWIYLSWESLINLNSLSLYILHQWEPSTEENLSFDENHPSTKTLHHWIILVKILIH